VTPASQRRARATPGAPASARRWRVAVPIALVAIVLVVLAMKPNRETPSSQAAVPALMASHGTAVPSGGIPRLVDLGADKCIPCKAMAPILVELRAEYAGQMQVDFIDVWKNPGAGEPYNIYAIPTQIFFDGSGKELTRHEGFMSKEDILATWKRLGVDFSAPSAPTPKT
jgi:thioredoxin 1